MNQQRRLLLKAIGATGFFAAGYGTCYYLHSNQSSSFSLDSWLPQLVVAPVFEPLIEQYPNASQTIAGYVTKSGSSETQFLESIEKQIRQDYELNHLVTVEDWRISQTELLLMVAALQSGVAVVMDDANKTFDNAPYEDFLSVNAWGPQETYQGVKFNEQPDGHCGIWVSADNVIGGIEVYIGGIKRHAFVNENGLTTGIYDEVEAFINKIGESDIVVYDTIHHRKQKIGTFEVLPPFEFYRYENGKQSQVFGLLNGWGPQKAKVGEVFNEQSEGVAAFWIKISSRSNRVRLVFNGHSYQATVRKDIVTSSFPEDNIPTEPGYYPVHLISEEHNEKLHVGDFQVN